jgi:hypothetical protein
MTANQADFPIATMSAAFSVSRSGISARRSRPPSARALVAARQCVAAASTSHQAATKLLRAASPCCSATRRASASTVWTSYETASAGSSSR